MINKFSFVCLAPFALGSRALFLYFSVDCFRWTAFGGLFSVVCFRWSAFGGLLPFCRLVVVVLVVAVVFQPGEECGGARREGLAANKARAPRGAFIKIFLANPIKPSLILAVVFEASHKLTYRIQCFIGARAIGSTAKSEGAHLSRWRWLGLAGRRGRRGWPRGPCRGRLETGGWRREAGDGRRGTRQTGIGLQRARGIKTEGRTKRGGGWEGSVYRLAR
jgi:hypothetical protein